MSVHERAQHAALVVLAQTTDAISVEALAETINYSVQHTERILAALRSARVIASWRPHHRRALAYRVDRIKAQELGLLP